MLQSFRRDVLSLSCKWNSRNVASAEARKDDVIRSLALSRQQSISLHPGTHGGSLLARAGIASRCTGPLSIRHARQVTQHRSTSRCQGCVRALVSLFHQRAIDRRGFLELSLRLGRKASPADCCVANGISDRTEEAGSGRIPVLYERGRRELSRRSIDRFREKVTFARNAAFYFSPRVINEAV